MTHHHVQEAPIFGGWEMLRLLRAHGFPFHSTNQFEWINPLTSPSLCAGFLSHGHGAYRWWFRWGQDPNGTQMGGWSVEGLPVSLSTSQLRIFNYIFISKDLFINLDCPFFSQILSSEIPYFYPDFEFVYTATSADFSEVASTCIGLGPCFAADGDKRIPVEIIPMDVPNSH